MLMGTNKMLCCCCVITMSMDCVSGFCYMDHFHGNGHKQCIYWGIIIFGPSTEYPPPPPTKGLLSNDFQFGLGQ